MFPVIYLMEKNMRKSLQGYENVLCGSCSAGFGKLRSLECGRCQGYSSSLFGFIFVSLWLWFLAGMLIRKSLAWANEVTNEVTEETISVEVFDYEISKNRASEIAKVGIVEFPNKIACDSELITKDKKGIPHTYT